MKTSHESSENSDQKGDITVKIRSLLKIKQLISAREVCLTVPKGTTVRSLLEIMVQKWGPDLAEMIFEPDSDQLLYHIQLMVNGQNIRFLQDMDTILKTGDEFLIFPPAGGG